jgi:hypothetical protein
MKSAGKFASVPKVDNPQTPLKKFYPIEEYWPSLIFVRKTTKIFLPARTPWLSFQNSTGKYEIENSKNQNYENSN